MIILFDENKIVHNRLSLTSGNERIENEYTNKRTQDVYVENPEKRENPLEPTDFELLHYIYERIQGDSQATTSSSSSSPTCGYNRDATLLPLSLSHTVTTI